MGISLDEAKHMMTKESINKLKDIVVSKPVINMENKVNNDILMQALCRAVSEDVIHVSSLNDRLIKLLNSATNTLSQSKLGGILEQLRIHQPRLVCVISLMNSNMSSTLNEWVFTGPIVKFNGIFEYVLKEFNISPSIVRSKLVDTLKPTIVNNIAQLIAKYENAVDKDGINVSINTITRLVNMEGHLLFAEFVER